MNACGASPSTTMAVSSISLPVITVPSGSICEGQTYTMSPSGANTYTFSSGSAAVSPTVTSSYSVTGSNTLGCVSLSPAVSLVTVKNAPVITVNSGSICAGNSLTIAPSGASTYTISGNNFIVSPLTTTSYSVVGTSTAGCISLNPSTATVTVFTFSLPVITVNSGSICSGKSFTLTPSGALTYTFLNGGPIVSPTSNTNYSVNGTSAQGCIGSSPALALITIDSGPNITVNSGSICVGRSFTIIPSGAINYSISGGSFIVSPVTNSVYNVTGQNNSGCVSSSPGIVNITVYQLPTVTVSTTSTLLCIGETVTLTANGASSYTFDPGGIPASSLIVSPASTSSYTLTGSSVHGCVNSASLTQIVDACTSLTEKEFTDAIVVVFPNPTSGMVNLHLNSHCEVFLLNSVGQVIYYSTFDYGNHQINLENFCKGIYFMRVVNGNILTNIKVLKE